jgi:CheY-like chemotaxis protein
LKTKVLIVDDYPANVRALALLIEDQEIEIYSASSGEEALGLVLDHEFGLALLDVQMPVMSGFELAKLIRGIDRGKRLPIIFVTAGNHDAATILRAYENGAVDVLFKPLDPQVVRTKVRVFVQLDQTNKLLQARMEEMSILKERAESADAAKSNFLRNISHELRTPLSSVLGFADLMRSSSPADSLVYLESIQRNGAQLLHVIDDILDMSLLLSGGASHAETMWPEDRRSQSAPSAAATSPAILPAPLTAGLKGKHILVVDDVADNRVLVERYLTPSGVSVSCASGGGEAIVKATSEACDLVLMDIQMPGMDGCEATAKLRAQGFRKPIVALTAHALSDELNRCLRAGCDLALTKPITKKALVEQLAQILTPLN